MRTLLTYSVCLGLVVALGACSSDDDDTGAAASASGGTGGTGGSGGSSSTIETPADEPVDGDAAGNPSTPAATDGAPVALQPALPVVENPDHAALLASDVPV